MRLFEILLSGIVGASGALIAVWLTTNRNAAENAANRLHQLNIERIKAETAAKHKSLDNRWTFHKDVYVTLLTLVSQLIQHRLRLMQLLNLQKTISPDDVRELQAIHEQKAENLDQYATTYKQYVAQVCMAQLAMADGVLLALKKPHPTPIGMTDPDPIVEEQLKAEVSALTDILNTLANAGRKDLWENTTSATAQ